MTSASVKPRGAGPATVARHLSGDRHRDGYLFNPAGQAHDEAERQGAGRSLAWALTWRKKLSPMPADSQFQVMARYPGNFDRCRRCGIPRKLHGADGSCSISVRSRLLALFLVVAGTLAAIAGAAWLLASDTAITAGSAAAFACLVALTLLAASTAVVRRGR
jgi:hypothetical protein